MIEKCVFELEFAFFPYSIARFVAFLIDELDKVVLCLCVAARIEAGLKTFYIWNKYCSISRDQEASFPEDKVVLSCVERVTPV